MSAAAVCGWVAAPAGGAVAVSSKSLEARQKGQRLVPVVGLVNRRRDVQVRKLRWERRKLAKGEDGRQQWRAQSSSNNDTQTKLKALDVSESQFEAEVLQSSVPVLVDFWATWCGPCRLMGIALDWAAQEYGGKVKCVKIESDKNQSLVDKYKVYGLPTLILFLNGQPLPNTHREGAINKDKLKKYIDDNLPAAASS